MKRNHLFFLFLIIGSLSLSSCFLCKKNHSKEQKTTNSPLAHTSWELSSITYFKGEETPKPVTLVFREPGQLGGTSGCNSYGATYTLSKKTLKFELGMATQMACMPGMDTEKKFFEVMRETDAYELKGDELYLKKNDKVLAIFYRK